MSQIPSLRAEADELKEFDAFIMDTFKHCDAMKTDILEYSSGEYVILILNYISP